MVALGLMIKLGRLTQQPKIPQWLLAKKLNIAPQVLSLYEVGRKEPSEDFLKECTKALGLSPTYFSKSKISSPQTRTQYQIKKATTNERATFKKEKVT